MTTLGGIQETAQAVISVIPPVDGRPQVMYRVAGESYLLLEYGEVVLDLALRLRVHSLERALRDLQVRGIIETAPGVRSLLIHYDCLELRLPELVETLTAIEVGLPPAEEMEVPSRTVHLPIACHERWTAEAVAKYMQSVRAEAPYVPDNVEFIARCNGLAGVAEVQEYVLATQHMVIGLGDVYLGRSVCRPSRSSATPGRSQVQSGTHVDSRGRGGDRRRLPLYLPDGVPWRLPALRPHSPNLEHDADQRRLRRGPLAPACVRPHRVRAGRARTSSRSCATRCSRASTRS